MTSPTIRGIEEHQKSDLADGVLGILKADAQHRATTETMDFDSRLYSSQFFAKLLALS